MEHFAIHKLSKTHTSLLPKVSNSLCCGNPNSVVFFYHSDHLGSASWITNGNGNPVQHLQYMPYGEPFVNERTTGYEERFTFTGKERDSETGFSYFGARYYDSDLMMGWLSVDPLADKYPSLSPYNYCALNPIKVIDPNGDSCAILLASEAVCDFGHMAILVQGDDNKWYLYSKNGEGKNISGSINLGRDNEHDNINGYSSVEEFMDKYTVGGEKYYTQNHVLPTTPEQDKIIAETMKTELKKEYNLFGSNCSQAVNNALIAAGVKTNENPVDSFFEQINIFKHLGDNIIPTTMYENIMRANGNYQELKWKKKWLNIFTS